MIKERLLLILVLIFIVQQSDAHPVTLYTDDFLTTPAGWTVYFDPPSSPPSRICTLNFGPQGASFFSSIQANFPSVYYINFTNPFVAIVPTGTDHLNLYAAQIVHTETYGAWASGAICLIVNGAEVGNFYVYNDPWYLDDPINIDILPSEFNYMPGDTIGFKVFTQILSIMDPVDQDWWGILRWEMTDFTLTAYDEAQLHRYTWGRIKTLPSRWIAGSN